KPAGCSRYQAGSDKEHAKRHGPGRPERGRDYPGGHCQQNNQGPLLYPHADRGRKMHSRLQFPGFRTTETKWRVPAYHAVLSCAVLKGLLLKYRVDGLTRGNIAQAVASLLANQFDKSCSAVQQTAAFIDVFGHTIPETLNFLRMPGDGGGAPNPPHRQSRRATSGKKEDRACGKRTVN